MHDGHGKGSMSAQGEQGCVKGRGSEGDEFQISRWRASTPPPAPHPHPTPRPPNTTHNGEVADEVQCPRGAGVIGVLG